MIPTFCSCRLNTDIEFGNAHGMSSLLLLSGVTGEEQARVAAGAPEEEARRHLHRPDYVLGSLGALRETMM